jgi:carbon storage regulator
MLVLTRKYQEKIRIGDNITITVLRLKGKAVRLGIDAPDNVPVIRGELSFASEPEIHANEVPPGTTVANPADDMPLTGRMAVRTAHNSACWEKSSQPNATGAGATNSPDAVVGFSRVSRDKVAGLLPKLAAGPAPLRAMMHDGRA